MTRLSAVGRLAVGILCGLWLTGCDRVSSGPLDEQRDPHFIAGKNKVRAYDFEGAIESFERAAEANPASASAHFELGVLYREHTTNAAAAIYHFERYLKLRPDSEFAEPVRQHILACKQELASSVLLDPVAKGFQRELDRLTKENEFLKSQVAQLQASLARRPAVEPPPAAPARGQPDPSGPAPTPVLRLTKQDLAAGGAPREAAPAPPPPSIKSRTSGASPAPAARPRTHVVRKGETAYAIAKQHGISVRRLCEANPTLDPNRVRAGQTLTIPAW
jgi:tetratricopeptide (TPR) repeat protein